MKKALQTVSWIVYKIKDDDKTENIVSSTSSAGEAGDVYFLKTDERFDSLGQLRDPMFYHIFVIIRLLNKKHSKLLIRSKIVLKKLYFCA